MADKITFNLGGQVIEFDKIQYVVKQLCDGVELRIKENTDTIISNRINGVPFKISHMQGKDAWDIVPYMWDNTEYIKSAIADTKFFVNGILKDHGITINPNWQEINSQWLSQLKKIEDIFSDALKTCSQAAMQNQVVRYNQAYNEELSKDFGLSFGILSNSLTAHLVYAAQETAKERKDHERASKAAAEAMNDAGAKITVQVYENVHPLYVDSVEPALLKLLSEYYSYIVSIFANELGTTPDEIKSAFDEEKSNEILQRSSSNPKEAIVNAFAVDPDNGNVIGYAILNGVLDDELCQYGKFSSAKFQLTVKKWAENKLGEIFNKGKLFNKPIINDDNRDIIGGLIEYFSFVSGNIRKCKEWQDIVINVYGKEIATVIQDFSQISLLIMSPNDFDKAAKEQKKISISDSNRHLFVLFCNELHVDTIIKTVEVFNLQCPVTIGDINKTVSDFSKKLVTAHDDFVKREEQLRLEKEEKERINKEKQQIIIERKKRKAKIVCIILASVICFSVVIVFITNLIIIPAMKYSAASTLRDAGKYDDAILAFEAIEGYKDSTEQIAKCKNAIIEEDYIDATELMNQEKFNEAIIAFENLKGYKESANNIIFCQDKLNELAYNDAVALMKSGKNEEAVSEFKKLGNYKDSKSIIIEISKIIASNYETSGNTEKAISWYKSIGETEKIKSIMYDYIVSHKSRSDLLTYDYLLELKNSDYKDTHKIYNTLYRFTLTMYIENYKLCYIVSGGPPKGDVSIRIVNESHWNKASTYSVSQDFTLSSSADNEGVLQISDITLIYAYVHRITAYDAASGDQLAQIFYN